MKGLYETDTNDCILYFKTCEPVSESKFFSGMYCVQCALEQNCSWDIRLEVNIRISPFYVHPKFGDMGDKISYSGQNCTEWLFFGKVSKFPKYLYRFL